MKTLCWYGVNKVFMVIKNGLIGLRSLTKNPAPFPTRSFLDSPPSAASGVGHPFFPLRSFSISIVKYTVSSFYLKQ